MENEQNNNKLKIIENMHNTFLEALRHREQEILQYIAILAPALGGFIWLIKWYLEKIDLINVFVIGTIGVLFLLTLGAVYSLALGFNFRYVTFQLAKIESKLDIKDYILNGWERNAEEWIEKYKTMKCYPPEIIKVFWIAFIVAELFVALAAASLLFFTQEHSYINIGIIIFILICGTICLTISWIWLPRYYGKKLFILCVEEKGKAIW